MPPKQPNPDFEAFQEAVVLHEDLMTSRFTDQTAALDSLNQLEVSGTPLLVDKNTGSQVAESLHKAFQEIVEVEVVPPLDDIQRATLMGKVLIYKTLSEAVSQPHKPGATPTTGLPTDKSKGT
jgi:hypothetical protein